MRLRGRRWAPAWAGAIAAVAAAAVAAVVPGASDDAPTTYGYVKLFNEVLSFVRTSYVEPVPEGDLLRGAYEGLLASLDGESEYLTAKEYADASRRQAEAEADAGISLTRREGVLFVAAVLPGSDAQAKGLRLGDQIRRIGDRSGRELGLSGAQRALRGPAGSSVIVAISRREEPRREEIEVRRLKLSLPAPRLEAVQDGVAVIRLGAFGAGSARALSGILDRLHRDKVARAVLDLRGNACGDRDEAGRAASLLTGEGVVARLRDREGRETPVLAAGPRSAWRGQALILTDAGTAGAAEMFAAALVDAGAARHAGEATLGRGGEREYLALPNGDVIALTVRKLVSPSGKGWHGTGLSPEVAIPADGAIPFAERSERQLRKAVEWLRDAEPAAKAA
jgi:carboxyl-terminal processing protease